jgi:hypothetical protein
MDFINNILVWIIAFFGAVVFIIIQFIILILIKMKTHAFTELRAFFKKSPVSLFFDDGKFFDMKAIPVNSGVIEDKEYGMFVRHRMNTYLGKQTRNVYDVYDTRFAVGSNVHAANAAQLLKSLGLEEKDFDEINEAIAKGTLSDERLDCLRSNVNIGHLKHLYNYIEPHNIQASTEKKASQRALSMAKSGSATSVMWLFIGVFGAIIAAVILLRMFNIT